MATTKPKAALVTGAARRIGRAIALDLAEQGFAVGLHHHESAQAARALQREIEARGGRAALVKADLGREADVKGLVRRTERLIGPLTVLVNNAAVFDNDTVASATRRSWDRHMEINLRAPFVLTQEFAQRLPARTKGNVINLIDQRVFNLTPFFTSYTVSKVGLWALTQTLALALAPRIRVNAIGPGPTLPSVRQTARQFAEQWRAFPLQRPVELREVTAAIRFLLNAPSVTGQMIAIDSGQHLGWSHGGRPPRPE
ncbi:MAG: SDR family oxidoreductase [Rhodospirillales bacterium]|nr:SDR family oxidoreductase [Rhodospirillales bacterium]